MGISTGEWRSAGLGGPMLDNHRHHLGCCFCQCLQPGNFLVSKELPFKPILLDFGLTKSLPISKKQALVKMLLACAKGDYAALLSSFAELGLKLQMDMPEDAMAIMNFFFHRSIPGKESQIMEVTTDAQMKQTMQRPLPSGCMGMSHAVAFAVTMGVSGVILLAWKANITAELGAANVLLYTWYILLSRRCILSTHGLVLL